MKKIAILFSGWNQRGVIAFCRFCRKRNIPFRVIARDEKDPVLLTDYKNEVLLIRKEKVLTIEFMRNLYSELSESGFDYPVLMPSTEYLNRFYLSNRQELETIGFIIPLCDTCLYDKISDKSEFEELCKGNDISTPKEYSRVTEKDIPFVVKPRKYFFRGQTSVAEKPKLIMDIGSYESLGTIDYDGYYCQEFVGGDSYYLLYYFAKDGSYRIYSQKNLVQQHSGLSIVAAESSTIHEDSRAEVYTRMFQKIGFRGLVMVEIRDYKGKFYMIEANPRFWGPSQLILDAGMDLFELFAVDNGLLDDLVPSNYKPGIKYSWVGGFIETSSVGEIVAYHNGYNAEKWVNHFSEWIESDIYRREDTIKLFDIGD